MASATSSATLNTQYQDCDSPQWGGFWSFEDDSALRKVLRRLFSSEGYAVDVAADAVCGLERLRQGTPAAVVLDLPRPGSSGCDLCEKIANLIPDSWPAPRNS
jgi:DNA-binding response OmpR family regulator